MKRRTTVKDTSALSTTAGWTAGLPGSRYAGSCYWPPSWPPYGSSGGGGATSRHGPSPCSGQSSCSTSCPFPAGVVVGDTALEIRCIVEITHIKYADLRSIRRIPPETMKKSSSSSAVTVFFGYYGYYIDGKSWETLKLYCKQWDNFIEITDAYEKRFIISSPAPDDLVAAVTRAIRYYSDSAPGE